MKNWAYNLRHAAWRRDVRRAELFARMRSPAQPEKVTKGPSSIRVSARPRPFFTRVVRAD